MKSKSNRKKLVLLIVLIFLLAGILIYPRTDLMNTKHIKEENREILRETALKQSVENHEKSGSKEFSYSIDNEEIYINEYLGNKEMVVIPEQLDGLPVVSIKASAFRGQSQSVKHIVLPASISIINKQDYSSIGTFQECTELERIDVAEENKYFKSIDGVLFNREQTILIKYPPKKKAVSYKVSERVLKIEEAAFLDCDVLEELILPENLIKIGARAINGCSSLKAIALSEGVTTIEEATFARCSSLEEVKLPASLFQIEDNVFNVCGSLKSIEVAKNNQAFNSDEGILFDREMTTLIKYPAKKQNTSYSVPKSVERIRKYAFEKNEYLKEVILSEGLEEIEQQAFYNCTSLMNIKLPSSLIHIGTNAFYNNALTHITIPQNVEELEKQLFNECKQLQEIIVNANNKVYRSIDGVLFDKAQRRLIDYPRGKKQTTYAVPEGTYIIGERAFEGNPYLTSVTLPKSIIKVENYAFNYCEKLVQIIIDGILLEMGENVFTTNNPPNNLAEEENEVYVYKEGKLVKYEYEPLIIYAKEENTLLRHYLEGTQSIFKIK